MRRQYSLTVMNLKVSLKNSIYYLPFHSELLQKKGHGKDYLEDYPEGKL